VGCALKLATASNNISQYTPAVVVVVVVVVVVERFTMIMLIFL
jgi:hypothetical protein